MSLSRISHDDDNHFGSAKRNVANGIAGLDGSADVLLAQIPDALTGKKTDLNAVVSSGLYTGNNTVNRAIPHGLGVKPKHIVLDVVEISVPATVYLGSILEDGYFANLSINTRYVVTTVDDTNFYVGNAVNYPGSGNGTLYTNNWVAIS